MRTTCGLNFSPIGPLFLELLPQNLQNWAQLGHEAKKKYFVTLKGHAKFGLSVSQNKSHVKVFWFRQFTFQTKERNQI